jgi:hypothetical protein
LYFLPPPVDAETLRGHNDVRGGFTMDVEQEITRVCLDQGVKTAAEVRFSRIPMGFAPAGRARGSFVARNKEGVESPLSESARTVLLERGAVEEPYSPFVPSVEVD